MISLYLVIAGILDQCLYQQYIIISEIIMTSNCHVSVHSCSFCNIAIQLVHRYVPILDILTLPVKKSRSDRCNKILIHHPNISLFTTQSLSHKMGVLYSDLQFDLQRNANKDNSCKTVTKSFPDYLCKNQMVCLVKPLNQQIMINIHYISIDIHIYTCDANFIIIQHHIIIS